MTFLGDPESDNIIVKGLVAIVTGMGVLLIALGKRMGGNILQDIRDNKEDVERVEKSLVSCVQRDELRVCQIEVLKTVNKGFTQLNESVNTLSKRLDGHIDKRGTGS